MIATTAAPTAMANIRTSATKVSRFRWLSPITAPMITAAIAEVYSTETDVPSARPPATAGQATRVPVPIRRAAVSSATKAMTRNAPAAA